MNKSSLLRVSLVAAGYCFGLACSGGADGAATGSYAEDGMLEEGIYRLLDVATLSEGCEPDVPSLLATAAPRYASLVHSPAAASLVIADSCADPEQCRDDYLRYVQRGEPMAPTSMSFRPDPSARQLVAESSSRIRARGRCALALTGV
jgi:hypothetical protein